MIYPWQQATWQQLSARMHTLPHAILLSGQKGLGKTVFAQHLAQSLLCQNLAANRSPCQNCPSCHLFAQQSHPDYLFVAAQTDGASARKHAQIKVDEVREILAFAQLSSHQGGRRIVVIEEAENLNLQAANALLKVLEEPPEKVLFVLTANQRERLLPTILSRVQIVHLPKPSQDEIEHYQVTHQLNLNEELLAFYAGSPLVEEDAATQALRTQWLDVLSKPRLLALLDFAQQFDQQKRPLGEALDWFYKWLIDMALCQQGLAALYYPHKQEALQRLPSFGADKWQQLVEKVHQLLPYGHHSLNVKLQLEDICIDYLNLMTQKE